MRQVTSFSIFFVMGLIFLTNYFIYSEESLYFQLDAKQWKIAAKNISNDEAMIELIPHDENILNWSEMLTIQKFLGLNVTPEKFIELISTANLEGYQSRTKVINEKLSIIENSYIAEKSNEKEMIHSEYALSRALKGSKNLYYVRYATSKAATFDAVESAWIEKLTKVSISEKEPTSDGSAWFKFSDNTIYKGNKPLSFEPETVTLEDAKAGFHIEIPKDWVVSQKWSFSHKIPQLTILLQANSPDNTIQLEVSMYSPEEAKHNDIDQLTTLLDDKGSYLTTALGDKGRYVSLVKEGKTYFYVLFESKDRIYRLEFVTAQDQFEKSFGQILGIARNFHIIR